MLVAEIMVSIFVPNSTHSINDSTDILLEVFRWAFRRIVCSSLGESAGEAVIFFIKETLRRDPIEVLWENPRAVYDEMVRLFGEGTKILISILILNINREYGLSMDPEYFLELMYNGGQSAINEIRSFIESVAKARGGR